MSHFTIAQRLLTAIFFVLCAYSTEAKKPNETLRFSETVHNFGDIKEENGKVSHTFRFTNTGKQPAVILYARSGCNCVRTEIPKKPVASGQSATITVTYNPDYRPGTFSKEIVVMCADETYTRIHIKGNVIPSKHPITDNYPYEYGHGLYMNFKRMVFATVRAGQEKTMKLRIANNSKKTIDIRFEVKNPEYGVMLPSKTTLRPGEEAVLPVTVRISKDFSGLRVTRIVPIANGARLNPLEVTMNGTLGK